MERNLFQKQTLLQRVKKFPAFYGTRKAITISTSGSCLTPDLSNVLGSFLLLVCSCLPPILPVRLSPSGFFF